MNENETGAQFAAQQHLQTVTTQSAIILDQQKEIDRLNAQLIEKVDESARLREQLAALEQRLRNLPAPMSRSTGMRCAICCAKSDEPHLPSCPEGGGAGQPK
jgi:uncharacterized coiled-coil protein SlyX